LDGGRAIIVAKRMAEHDDMSKADDRAEHLFMVRLWREPGSSPQVRGLIEDVHAQQRFYFSSLAELNEFIRLRLPQ
jgi:hypothetical protein